MESVKMSKVRSALLMLVVLLVGVSAVSAQEQTTITLQGGSSGQAEDAALTAMVEAFEAANPDVNVEIVFSPDHPTTMQTGFAAGDYANVFYVDSSAFQDWASAGVLYPAGPELTDAEGIYESLRNIFTYDGTLYCPAKDFSTLALVYNVDMFEAAGVEVPTTWEELNAAAAALTTDDVAGFTAGVELARFMPFIYQNGGAILDADGALVLDSDEARGAVAEFVDLFTSGAARTPSDLGAGWAGEAFGQGKAAMTIEGNWIIQNLLDNFPDLNWSVAEVPAGPAGQATMAFTVCYGIADPASSSSQTPEALDASLRLVNFLTGDEGAAMVAASGFGVMPSRGSAAEAWLAARGEEYQPFVTGADYSLPWSFPPGFGTFIDTFNGALNEAITGAITSDEVVTQAAEAAQEAIDDAS